MTETIADGFELFVLSTLVSIMADKSRRSSSCSAQARRAAIDAAARRRDERARMESNTRANDRAERISY